MYWYPFKTERVASYERMLVTRNDEIVEVLGAGRHWKFDFSNRLQMERYSMRDGWLLRDDLDLLKRSGKLNGDVQFVDLADNERALVWFDDRFEAILGSGLYALWTGFKDVKVELFEAADAKIETTDLARVVAAPEASRFLQSYMVREGQVGLLWLDGQFGGFLDAGLHAFWREPQRVSVEVFEVSKGRFEYAQLDAVLAHSEASQRLKNVRVVEGEVGLVWLDGRFEGMFGPGQYAWWTAVRKVEVEVVQANAARVEHAMLPALLEAKEASQFLNSVTVAEGQAGLVYVDGELKEVVSPGQYAYWQLAAKVNVVIIEMRETVLDVTGQEIMTRDKVTLRVNAALTFRVTDAQKAVSEVADFTQALYRDAQLALREVIGTRELDTLLTEKDAASAQLREAVQLRSKEFGVEIVSLGIKDLILPGEMKDLLNKVTEARKAAEAAAVTRREETAAVRSQLNTAKLMETSPTLMRLRELELVERVAQSANLNVVLGEKSLTDRVMKLV